ncbi:MAG: hypothetical protein JJU29_23680 [Verrucomicrobia bacterium]|nr:hypothetical protein [Verrucomicrobiota bacterium]MCH8510114.1 hypothetical protein [Kiritimatiellia bacterium]
MKKINCIEVFLISKWAQRCLLTAIPVGILLILYSKRDFPLSSVFFCMGVVICLLAIALLLVSDRIYKNHVKQSKCQRHIQIQTKSSANIYAIDWPLRTSSIDRNRWIFHQQGWENPSVTVTIMEENIGDKVCIRKEIDSVKVNGRRLSNDMDHVQETALDGGLLLLVFAEGSFDDILKITSLDLKNTNLVAPNEVIGVKEVLHETVRMTYIGLIVEERVFRIAHSKDFFEISFPND